MRLALGNPGTGKTTVALRKASHPPGLGYIKKVSRDELVGQYVRHTAPNTKEVLKRAYGAVLFSHEAYLHRPENERDYGQEAIEILLLMEATATKSWSSWRATRTA